MSKRITKWSPDTCECIVEFEWDDTQEQSEQTYTGKNIVKSCQYHNGSVAELFDTVIKENQGKNKALGAVLNVADEIVDFVEDGKEVVRQFKQGKEPAWSFDESRRLHIKLPNESKGKEQSVRAEINKGSDIEVIID